jgi:hypothetical protein
MMTIKIPQVPDPDKIKKIKPATLVISGFLMAGCFAVGFVVIYGVFLVITDWSLMADILLGWLAASAIVTYGNFRWWNNQLEGIKK